MAIRQQLARAVRTRSGDADFWICNFLFFALLGAFWPVTVWVAGNAADQSRLLHALIVLLMATITLVKFGNIPVEGVFSLNPPARRALILSFSLLLVQFVGRHTLAEAYQGFVSLLAIPAYCGALAALVRYVLGTGTTAITRTTSVTFCGFLLLSILMAPLDWPLRGIAGQFSASTLAFLGQSVQLGMLNTPSAPPMLILLVNEHPFHVASECNGFGIILTSLLIALLLAFHRAAGPVGILINLVIGLLLGVALNTLRIVLIILLAPALMDHYMLMHEIVGGISYWGGLLLVWIVLRGPTRPAAS